jgi:hypothetical protein
LSQTSASELFSSLEGKLKSGEKATRLELMRLAELPGVGKFDYGILAKCFDYGLNSVLFDQDVNYDYYMLVENIYFNELTQRQLDSLKRSEVMSAFLESVENKGRLEGELKGLEKGKLKGFEEFFKAMTLLKQGRGRQEIIKELDITEEWLSKLEQLTQ